MNAWILLILFTGMAASVYWKKLTIPAAITGGIVGWLIYAGAGSTGLLMLAAFFIMGTAATSWKKRQKQPAHQVTRTTSQVLANGGVAALMGLGILLFPHEKALFEIMMAGSLASAAADTLSSELGMVYGRRFYNILTWKPDQKGRDGVVSIEGLILGLIGSAVIAVIFKSQFWIIILSGTIGNLIDSILGATLERKNYIGNNAVNFANTLFAAIVAGALAIAAA